MGIDGRCPVLGVPPTNVPLLLTSTLPTDVFYCDDIKGITQMQKPEKIYLENTNFQFAFTPKNADLGSLRETFFINQLSYSHAVEYVKDGISGLTESLSSRWEAKTNLRIK